MTHRVDQIFISTLFLVLICGLSVSSPTDDPKDYCVVGAGPAGMQLAYFLKQAGRNYAVYERAASVVYPRHRRLISINKRQTGRKNKEFNLRHDWNSLLSNDPNMLFKFYSSEYYPHADEMVRYLDDFYKKFGLNVIFNTDIWNISKTQEPGDSTLFVMQDQHGNFYKCKVLVVSTGLSRPNEPSFEGSDLTISYENVSTNPLDYQNKSLLILGRGNSAFETADAVYGRTNLIHMVSRSRARLSWSTHYVGDLRGINNALLDNYQLKSLDGLFEVPVQQLLLYKEREKIFVARPRIEQKQSSTVWDNFSLRDGYDMVIRCLGFTFDDSLFHRSLVPGRGSGRKRKYPAVTPGLESVSHSGLYYAGTITHSLDFRKSAGGFIHGFRYTIQALHRMLEKKYHHVSWPANRLPLVNLHKTLARRINEASGLYQMFAMLGDIAVIRRETQEFDYLEEVPVRLLPLLSEVTGHSGDVLLVVVMEYGKDFSGPSRDTFQEGRATGDVTQAHRSNFLHPVFYFYDQLPTEEDFSRKAPHSPLPKPKLIHHTLEDFLTTWTSEHTHLLPLRRFLENSLQEDLRHTWAEDCIFLALTTTSMPLACNHYVITGQVFSQSVRAL